MTQNLFALWHTNVCVCAQDATRMASAGCVGELCAFLSEEELKSVLLQHVLGLYLYATQSHPISLIVHKSISFFFFYFACHDLKIVFL